MRKKFFGIFSVTAFVMILSLNFSMLQGSDETISSFSPDGISSNVSFGAEDIEGDYYNSSRSCDAGYWYDPWTWISIPGWEEYCEYSGYVEDDCWIDDWDLGCKPQPW